KEFLRLREERFGARPISQPREAVRFFQEFGWIFLRAREPKQSRPRKYEKRGENSGPMDVAETHDTPPLKCLGRVFQLKICKRPNICFAAPRLVRLSLLIQ